MINLWIEFLPYKRSKDFENTLVLLFLFKIYARKLTLFLKMRSIKVAIQALWPELRGTFYFMLNAPQALSDYDMYKYMYKH